MSYQSTVAQLYALGHELASTPSHKFDLAYVQEMLAAMDRPERRFPSVLIAGTNGKAQQARRCRPSFALPDTKLRSTVHRILFGSTSAFA